eukprot:478012-Ditylum_brightwellii.AAC.1
MANGKAPGPSGATFDALKSMTWTESDPEEEGVNNDTKFLLPLSMPCLLFSGQALLILSPGRLAPCLQSRRRTTCKTQTSGGLPASLK